MNKRLLFQAFSLFLFMIALGGVLFFHEITQVQEVSAVVLPNETVITVEIAKNLEEQQKGLSGRNLLQSDTGMLFVYESPTKPVFWMKEMNFPIDIIWINNGKIVGFEENLIPEDPPTTRYSPVFLVDTVLEVNSGFIKFNNLKINDELDILVSN